MRVNPSNRAVSMWVSGTPVETAGSRVLGSAPALKLVFITFAGAAG
ncbi:hypothetical protein UF75_1744 [Desulfosporosinus sp. I2]|nr:hypothetical protein UF75_1744 [Desulfosporosinus sp. I2]